jgi:CxxC motif-containing protein (DUF1111 family)
MKRSLLIAALAAPWALGCSSAPAPESASAEPGEELPGGDTTNTFLLGSNAFTLVAQNASSEHEQAFYSGNSFFSESWVQAPASTEDRDGLGPMFNARSCGACHFKDGRGRPPLEKDENFLGILLRLSIEGDGPHGAPVPDPNYGGQLQPFSIADVPAEGSPRVSYETVSGKYPDGEKYELAAPTYEIDELAYGPFDETIRISPRVAPAVIGLGLLEAIPEEKLLELADPDDEDGDGISGRVNRVWDAANEEVTVGRFGWKAEQPSVRQQSAGAFLGDIGVTSSLFTEADCSPGQTECIDAQAGGAPELRDTLLDRVELYSRLLAVPMRERFDDADTLRGKQLFSEIGCASCHVASHVTGAAHDLPEVREQTIWPYTDLLLHDMGERLSDNRPSFAAEGAEWRTPPLWGLRLYRVVNRHERLLHDGRADGVEEAILWHGGEAEDAEANFEALAQDERELVIEFVESL